VGSAATSANAFPVEANINDADEHVRPGMTAELSLLFSRGEDELAYLVPLESVVPGAAKGGRFYVYVFDPETSTVRKTAVEGKGMIGDRGIITGGIAPGDIVVVAGVPFLRDGQEVKLMNPSQAAR
jgi:multidrug efflux pump subunit AcrA (membrane-fusion protein)